MLIVPRDIVAVKGDNEGHAEPPSDGQRQAGIQGEMSVDERRRFPCETFEKAGRILIFAENPAADPVRDAVPWAGHSDCRTMRQKNSAWLQFEAGERWPESLHGARLLNDEGFRGRQQFIPEDQDGIGWGHSDSRVRSCIEGERTIRRILNCSRSSSAISSMFARTDTYSTHGRPLKVSRLFSSRL